jgi:hypothetical protein
MIEKGKPKAEVGLIMAVVDSLGLCISVADCKDLKDDTKSNGGSLDLDDLLAEYAKR